MEAELDEEIAQNATNKREDKSLVTKDHIDERLEALLLQGLESGEPIEVTANYIQHKRAELL